MSKKYNSLGFGRDAYSQHENLRSSDLGSFFKTNWLMSILLLCGMLFSGFNASAQVTVTNPGNVGPTALSGTYTTLALAITDLNTKTSITGPVTITLNASNPQTCPAGGYAITAILTGASAGNQVTIAGSGNTITAPSPAGTAGSLNDAIFKFIGSDFMTLSGFVMNENGANTTTAAATNNMVEWGVALLYASTTNGAQNITIQNNTITLNRTYQNTFGIYSNSTHTNAAPTTSATATTTAGGNSGLKVYSNTITNVNNGIVVVGPTAVADANTGVEIGGVALGNTITNYGTTGTFSTYANVSGTVNGILVRNSNGFTISNNTVTSSVGGVTLGTLNGIQVAAASNSPTAAFTNNVNNNTISLQSGLAAGAMNGINCPSTSTSSTGTININGNNFTGWGHTVAASGTITFILSTSACLNTSISNNTFTNLSVNTTGSVTFFSNAISVPTIGGTQTISGNSIVTAFSKTGAGGTITVFSSNASSVTGSIINMQNNNFSNITATGATGFVGINNTDGGSPTKTITGNTFNSISGGTGTFNPMTVNFLGGVSSVSSNTFTNISWGAAVNALSIGSSSSATTLTIANNTITNLSSNAQVAGIICSSPSTVTNINNNNIRTLSSSGASVVVGIAIGGAATTNVFKNTISDISTSNAVSGTAQGMQVSAGTTVTFSNNRIGDLRAPNAILANAIVGFNVIGGTTVNAYYNTIYVNATSAGAGFGSSAVSAVTGTTLDLRNNIFYNTSTANTTGLTVAYRRSTTTLTSYASASNNNLFYAGTPGASNLIFNDGTNSDQTMSAYKSRVASRDSAAVTENLTSSPTFLSTTSGNANFLKISTSVATQLERGGITVSGFTTDFEEDTRNASTPDIGADEFAGTPAAVCNATPADSTINGVASLCSGTGTTLSLSAVYTDLLITYQWSSSTTQGGPYNTTLGTGPTQTTGNLTATTYYQCVITCTNSGLSFTTLEKSVLVNPSPTSVPTSNSPACVGQVLNLFGGTDTGVTYSWTGPNGFTSALQNPSIPTATLAAAGTYSYTTTSNGCSSPTNTTTVVVNPSPSAVTIAPVSASVCAGGSIGLVASGGNGNATLNKNSGTISVAIPDVNTTGINNTLNVSGVSGTITNVSVTFSITHGFTDDMIVNLEAPNGKILNLVRGASATSGVNFTNTVISSSSTTAIPAASAPYTGTFKADAATTGFQIAITPAPNTAIFSELYSSTPNGDWKLRVYDDESIGSGTLTNWKLDITTESPASFVWTPASSGLDVYTGPSVMATPTAQTTYTATSTVNGCSSEKTVVVSISSGAEITTDPVSTAKCVGQTALFNVVATGPGLTYQWRKGGNPLSNGGSISGATSPTLTITGVVSLDAGTYDVVVSATCGIPVTSNQGIIPAAILTVNNLPTVTVSPSAASICNPGGSAVTLTAGGASTYAWSPATGLSATTGSPVSANPTATTSYTVTGTDTNGCVNTAVSVVTVSNKPIITATTATPSTICSGGSSQLNVAATVPCAQVLITEVSGFETGTGAGSIPFSGAGDPIELTNASSSAVDISGWRLEITGTSPGSFTIPAGNSIPANGTFVISRGNTGPADIPGVFVKSALTAPSSGDSQSFILSNAGVIQDVATINGGTPHNPIGTGTPVVTAADWTASSPASTSGLGGLRRTVATDTNNASNWTVSSAGNLTNFGTINTAFTQISCGVPTYSWSPATFLSATNIVNPVATGVTGTTVYSVDVTANGCTVTGTVTVTVDPLVGAAATATSPKCAGSNFTVTAVTSGGGAPYNYSWSDGVGGVYANAQTVTVNKPAGSYTLTCTVTDACSGSAQSAIAVTVNGTPTVAISPTPANARICGTGTVSLEASGASTYSWSPTTALAPDAVSATVSSSATATTTYTVTGTDGNGCINTATHTVTVGPVITMGTVTATPSTICSGATSVLNASATTSATANYTVASIPVAIETPSGTPTVLANNSATPVVPITVESPARSLDDGYWDAIALPFSFTFYGVSYNSVRIATNGNVQFGAIVNGAQPGSSSWIAQTIPTAGGNLDNFIACPWIDQDMSTTPFGKLQYFVNGTSPNRKFVISYEAVKVFSSSDSNTSQIILNENGTVDVLLLGGGLLSTATKAIGIENAGGTLGTAAPGRNSGTWTTTANEAWRFTAPVLGINYAWTPALGLTPSASVASPTTPALTANASYSVTASDPVSGCEATGSVSVTVLPNYTITPSAGANGTISPNTVATVCSGQGGTYTITPDQYYLISDVTVNGTALTPLTTGTYATGGTYVFSNVTQNSTISVTFAPSCTNSGNPTSATASATTICNGQSTQLTLNGGGTGTGAVVTWYSGACGTENGGTLLGTTNGFSVSPTTTTTYYGRYEGTCSVLATTCQSVEITVTPLTDASVLLESDNLDNEFCDGATATFTATASNTNGGTVTYEFSVNGEIEQAYSSDNTFDTDSLLDGDTVTADITIVGGNCLSDNTVSSNPIGVLINNNIVWYRDADGDTYGNPLVTTENCTDPSTPGVLWVSDNTDCNDASATVHPNATEICFNNIDDDCDGDKLDGICAPVIVNLTNAYPNLMVLGGLSTTIISTIPVVPNPLGGNYPITGYIFEITKVGGAPTDVVELPTVVNKFNLTQTNIFAYDTFYDIRVRAIVNGEEQDYQGSVRRLKTPALASPVLLTSQCNVNLPSIGTVIFSQSVLSATDYEFTLTSSAFTMPATQVIVKQVNKFSLSMMQNYVPAYATDYYVTVRVKVGGAWSTGTTTACRITTPAVPTTQLVGTQCPGNLPSISSTLTANTIQYATQYTFKVAKAATPGVFVEKTVTGNPLLQLNTLTGLAIEYDTTYRVWVKAVTATTSGSYPLNGCDVTTPETPSSSVVAGPGVVGNCEDGFTVASNATVITSTTYPGAKYHYIIKGYNGNILIYNQFVDRSTNNNVSLSMFPTIPYAVGYTYYMSVALKFASGLVQPKEECEIILPGSAREVVVEDTSNVKVQFSATAYPNPFANNFMIDVKTRNESAVSLKVYDMIGRLVEQRSVSVSDLETTPIGDNYPSGVYNVIVTQGENVKTVRVVKR